MLIQWLQSWYAEQCNADWEHRNGIQISTLDNPGWRVTIDLQETAFEHVPFSEYQRNYDDDNDWIRCRVDLGTFEGVGGSRNLEEILEVFHAWILSSAASR